jgi:hypothetical protein
MLTSFESIKSELADSFDWLTEDNLYQFVEGFIPVYTNEIIEEWTVMPNEYDNSWMDNGLSANATITDRMSADLYNYYLDRVQAAYEELVEENEAEAEEEESE